ncbi:MAG: hypothetical protein NTW01_03655 [Gammaproteobacteria bacterium]|nr:hypothetical protein [Gammaproteobacteria bacterium]
MSSPLAPILSAAPARRQRGGARPAQLALLAIASALLIAAGGVAALGIGEPRQLSPLFEPLRVDVPVDAAGVEPAAVKVGVSFGGVDPAIATELDRRLRREWRLDPRGQYVLRISADTAIHEPLLQMRVEVGDGRIQAVRELTLLFDPAPAAPLPEAAATPAVAPASPSPPAAASAAAPQPVVPARPGAATAPPVSVPVVPRPTEVVTPAVAAVPPKAAEPAAASAQAQQDRIASTRLREQALSSADRWQRLPIAAGDTLASLAERARGGQTAIPLSLVEMLLRWLNPRAFDGVAGQPLAGAELRFPRPESLAAQLAASDGRWLSEAAASPAAAAAVPVAVLAGSPAADVSPMTEPGARPLPAAAALGAVAMPAAAATSATASGTPAGGAAGLFGSLSMWIGSVLLTSTLGVLLSLKLLGRLPAGASAEPLPGVVVARSLSATASASASSEALSSGPQALGEAPATFTRLDFAEPVAVERRDREARGRT